MASFVQYIRKTLSSRILLEDTGHYIRRVTGPKVTSLKGDRS